MGARVDNVKVALSGTPGTGTVSIGAAVAGYDTFITAQATTGQTYPYTIVENLKFEMGYGVYTAGSPDTFSRVTVKNSSAGFGTKETFSSAAVFYSTPHSDDFLLSYATASDVWAGTDATKIVTAATLKAAQALITLTDAGNITVDTNTFINATITLFGNRTLLNPLNLYSGKTGTIRVVQDGTGSRTLSYGSAYKFAGGAPTLTTAANAVDLITFECVDAATPYVNCAILKGFA